MNIKEFGESLKLQGYDINLSDDFWMTENIELRFSEIFELCEQVLNDQKTKQVQDAVLKPLKSGILDRNGKEVTAGCTIAFPYIDPVGKMHVLEEDFRAEVVFDHGCLGYYSKTSFTPLMEWQKTKSGEYVSNHGNKTIYTGDYPFIVV